MEKNVICELNLQIFQMKNISAFFPKSLYLLSQDLPPVSFNEFSLIILLIPLTIHAWPRLALATKPQTHRPLGIGGEKTEMFRGTRGNYPWDKTQERQGQE